MVKIGISKNGITKDIQQLIKTLRKNKKITGGENWWSSTKSQEKVDDAFDASKDVYSGQTLASPQNVETSQTTTNIETAKNINNAIGIAKGVSGALVAIDLVSHAAEPLLVASGVGIPLLAILIVAKKLAKQYKQNLQLNAILDDVIVIIQNSFFLEALIKKTMGEFSSPVQKALKKEVSIQSDIFGGADDELIKVAKTNDKIEERIKQKLEDLNGLLQKISPDNIDTKIGSLKKKMKRFFFSGELKNEIITNLSIINGLFTIYNSQFDWSIRYYESKILNMDNGKDEVKNIWNNIESSDEYKNYLFQTEEAIDDVIEDVKQNDTAIENIKKEIVEARQTTEEGETAQGAVVVDNTIVPNNANAIVEEKGGKKKTYKNKLKKRSTIKKKKYYTPPRNLNTK